MARYDKDAIKSAVRLSRVIADLTDQPLVKRGREFLVRCPFHDDTHPSLRIDDEKNDGVWRCDPCDIGGDVFAFVRQINQCSFPEALRFLAERYGVIDSEPSPTESRSSSPSGSWIYHRPDGEEAFKVERLEEGDGKKRFRQSAPDGRGGWICKRGCMDGVTRWLYRVDQLGGRDTVCLVEGEGVTDVMWKLGIPATTAPGGAGKWHTSDPNRSPIGLGGYAAQFTDAGMKTIAIFPDNDIHGRRYAEAAARDCHAAGLRVKMVALPGLPPKGDVVDFLEAGGTKAYIVTAIADAPLFEPATASSPEVPTGRDTEGGQVVKKPRRRTTPSWPSPLAAEALHGVFGDLVDLVAPETEADPVALLLTALVAFGNVIGRSASFMVGATRHHMNLFALLVGDTAKARKGTSLQDIFRFFRQVDKVWVSGRVQSGLSSGEGLIWAVRDPIEKQKPVKQKGHIVEYETVIEDHGVEDKRLLVVESEFANTLKVIKREGNTLSPTVRQAWDGGILNTMTKNSPAKATDAHVSILGHITSFELKFGGTEAQNGFANRFLIACAKRSRLLPEGGRLDEKNISDIVDQLRAAVECLTVRATPLVLHRDEEARRLWWAVYPKLSSAYPGVLGMVTARAEAQVTRLSCLYALGARSPVVRVEHLQAALALWRYCFESARYLFGDRTGDAVADTIRQALQRAGAQGLTRKGISKLLHGHRSTEDTDRALGLLADHGLARQEMDRSKPGRPVERWFDVREPENCEISELSSTPEPESGVSSHISHSASLDEEGDDGSDVARF